MHCDSKYCLQIDYSFQAAVVQKHIAKKARKKKKKEKRKAEEMSTVRTAMNNHMFISCHLKKFQNLIKNNKLGLG
jgi:CelD/BcsL family acetyltransferase involved in cellulose biosynthesis